MSRLPSAIFVVDIVREHIALAEATRLNIPIFAMVDTNSDPRKVNYAIPANDDATKSVEIIMKKVAEAIQEGLETRKAEKEKAKEEDTEKVEEKPKEKAEAKEEVKAEEVKAEEVKEAAAEPEVTATEKEVEDTPKEEVVAESKTDDTSDAKSEEA
ncbi:unnamed protein product [Cyprideis torosa]|uniref:Uncharacterized protein n=1 Tax=Cyprideis torosa TaxID=163714 RepID=A0A7R9A0X8_9CRUS|nr:unnamed protein product [Cyprideis torosa]CAG0911438.1 unnamed protein product [Cyprideis torosa]